jgi:hypothetical protein
MKKAILVLLTIGGLFLLRPVREKNTAVQTTSEVVDTPVVPMNPLSFMLPMQESGYIH